MSSNTLNQADLGPSPILLTIACESLGKCFNLLQSHFTNLYYVEKMYY